MSKVGEILFGDMAEDDKKLVVQLLTPVEVKHAKLVLENKSKTLDEVYKNVVGK